mgnify:CR=1 FL=1
MQSIRDALAKNRRDALNLSTKIGAERMRLHLKEAETDLILRLKSMDRRMKGTFTDSQMQATLTQVRHVLRGMAPGMRNVIVDTGLEAADSATGGVVEYLGRMNAKYTGLGSSSLALDESTMFTTARRGARASILRRLISSGSDIPGADPDSHLAKRGVIDRYGINVVNEFESSMRIGIVTKQPWETMLDSITKASPFLQGAPRSWAERIVRTEVMNSYNAAGDEATQEANEQLGDMVKILSATFDDRTGSDSYAVHGQIRRTEELFDTWYGQMQHPPARPNDREIVVPHRISWPLPPYLMPRSRGEVVARWKKEKRKGAPPPTPENTTVPRNRFGVEPPPRIR